MIARARINTTLITNGIAVGGYVLLSVCGAFQWVHTLAQRSVEGLNLGFLLAYALGLVHLQVAFRLRRVGLAYEIGNGLGLANALMMLGAWWWVRG